MTSAGERDREMWKILCLEDGVMRRGMQEVPQNLKKKKRNLMSSIQNEHGLANPFQTSDLKILR